MNKHIIMGALLFCPSLYAGSADVINVEVQCTSSCTFQVTLQHADTGWKHYANKWEVIGPNGNVLATRVLHHPHVNEQPFTRSLSGVKIPSDITHVTIRAWDSVHGSGGVDKQVQLPGR